MDSLRSKYGAVTRQLYRAILREITYLPDPAARSYARHQAVKRFRRGRKKTWEAVDLCKRKDSSPEEWVEPIILTKLWSGYRELARLQNATHGKWSSLADIILETYGRAGKRRRELISALVRPDPDAPLQSTATPALSGLRDIPDQLQGTRTVGEDKITYTISPRYPKLAAVVKAHVRHKFASSHARRPIQSPRVGLPAKNMWLRPMPRSREKNTVKKLYAALLDNLEAPLPEPEWERLRDQATGKIPWDGPRPRRSTTGGVSTTFDRRELYRLVNASRALDFQSPGSHDTPLDLDERELLSKTVHKYLEPIIVGCGPWSHRGKRVPDSRINARTMRRLWAHAFSLSPVLRWDESKKIWAVEWGSLQNPDYLPVASPEEVPASVARPDAAQKGVKPRERQADM